MTMEGKKFGLSSFSLHILAMLFMLCDHLCLTLLPELPMLRCVGRLAFPLFAFMAVEGYFHTRCFKNYLLRLLLLAVISEIPFNLLVGGTVFYPEKQNVIWTLILGLCCIWAFENGKSARNTRDLALCALVMVGSFVAALILKVDYSGAGVLLMLMFYLLRNEKHKLWQFFLLGMAIYALLGGLSPGFSQQDFAVLSLVFVWLYDGRQGLHGRLVKTVNYLFYPVHMLILVLLAA